MENMDKGLIVLKCVLINCLKIPKIPQNLSAQAQKFGIFFVFNRGDTIHY
jgi:hypothetical protein